MPAAVPPSGIQYRQAPPGAFRRPFSNRTPLKNPTLVAAAFAAALTSFAFTTGHAAAESQKPCPYLFGCSSKTADASANAEVKKPARVAAKKPKSKGVKRARRVARAPGVDPVQTGSIAPSKPAGSSPYSAIVARYATAYGVPVSLANAVIRIESNYQPNKTGSAGEVGLMQIKPATAHMLGYSGSTKALYNPETNIKYGMKYLAMAHDLGGGTTCGTILKYNAGHAAKRMNPISSAYCSKVKIVMASAGSPA